MTNGVESCSSNWGSRLRPRDPGTVVPEVAVRTSQATSSQVNQPQVQIPSLRKRQRQVTPVRVRSQICCVTADRGATAGNPFWSFSTRTGKCPDCPSEFAVHSDFHTHVHADHGGKFRAFDYLCGTSKLPVGRYRQHVQWHKRCYKQTQCLKLGGGPAERCLSDGSDAWEGHHLEKRARPNEDLVAAEPDPADVGSWVRKAVLSALERAEPSTTGNRKDLTELAAKASADSVVLWMAMRNENEQAIDSGRSVDVTMELASAGTIEEEDQGAESLTSIRNVPGFTATDADPLGQLDLMECEITLDATSTTGERPPVREEMTDRLSEVLPIQLDPEVDGVSNSLEESAGSYGHGHNGRTRRRAITDAEKWRHGTALAILWRAGKFKPTFRERVDALVDRDDSLDTVERCRVINRTQLPELRKIRDELLEEWNYADEVDSLAAVPPDPSEESECSLRLKLAIAKLAEELESKEGWLKELAPAVRRILAGESTDSSEILSKILEQTPKPAKHRHVKSAPKGKAHKPFYQTMSKANCPKTMKFKKAIKFKRYLRLWHTSKKALYRIIESSDLAETGDLSMKEALTYWEPFLERTTVMKDIGAAYTASQANLDGIVSEILSEEVLEVVRRLKGKAKGPDGVSYEQFRAIPRLAVQVLYNCILLTGSIPVDLKRCRTILIPKRENAKLGSDYRPLTIGNQLLRGLNSILAKRGLVVRKM